MPAVALLSPRALGHGGCHGGRHHGLLDTGVDLRGRRQRRHGDVSVGVRLQRVQLLLARGQLMRRSSLAARSLRRRQK